MATDKVVDVHELVIKPCPFCKEYAFEEIWPAQNFHNIMFEERRYYRINHKAECYMNNDSGDCFERFSFKEYKDSGKKYSTLEDIKRWNQRVL